MKSVPFEVSRDNGTYVYGHCIKHIIRTYLFVLNGDIILKIHYHAPRRLLDPTWLTCVVEDMR